MAKQGLFLGPDHDFSSLPSTGAVELWPRQRLLEKIQTIIADSRTAMSLTPGTASKIYGMMNFLEQGTYGRIGANGLTATKKRQYEVGRTWRDQGSFCG